MKQHTCCLLLAFSLACVSSALALKSEAELIAVLTSNAPQYEKAEACRDLAAVGTRQAVAPLAALLGDEKLAHMARYGLEAIPDPAADEALRAALGTLKGKLLVGAVNSVGVRRDAGAVEALTKLLNGQDADAAAASAKALARLGAPAAAEALKASLGTVPAAAEALLTCAARAPAPEQAVALYDAVRAAQASAEVKVAAVRGAILSRGVAGIPLLMEQLESGDADLAGIGLRAAQELPGKEVTAALCAELPKLSDWKQARLCAALGERADVSAVPALLAATRGGAAETRIAAIGAVTRMNAPAAVPVLAELAAGADEEVAKAAGAALAGFAGKDVDAAIVALLARPDAKQRGLGVELVGKRRVTAAVPELLRLASEADPQVSLASLKVLGDLATTNEVPALLGILMKTGATEAAADALAAVCARQAVGGSGTATIRKAVYGVLPDGPSKDVTEQVAGMVKSGQASIDVSNKSFGDPAGGRVKRFRVEYTVNGIARSATAGENQVVQLNLLTDPKASPAVAGPLLAAYAQAKGAPKGALLRILCAVGGPQALAAVRAATADADKEIQESALRALCDWPTGEAIPDLKALAQSAPVPKFKILALRGYVRLVANEAGPAEAKVAALKEAFGWAARDDERRLVLAALGTLPASGALEFVAACFDKPGLQNEACLAAVTLAEALSPYRPKEVSAVLKSVVKLSKNESVLKRAKKTLSQMRKAEEEEKAALSEDGFKPMCNGKDLSEWDTKGVTWWKVVDGILTAESTTENPLATNNHLIWKGGQPGDFEIRTDFRLTKSANSGIQLRAEAVADRDTGYQADMNGGGNFVGFLYHPKMHLVGGRGEQVTIAADGKKESQRFADSAELQKLYKVEDWNTYRIICRGPEIILYVNGALMCRFADYRPDTPRQGAITLQLHKGPPMKIEYRNLRIKVLK